MDYFTGLAVLAGGAILKTEVLDYGRAWIAYSRSGEYNLDGKPSSDKNPDWCKILNTATGDWFIAKIVAYDPPWTPGRGGVKYYTFGEDGETPHYCPWVIWANTGHTRAGIPDKIKDDVERHYFRDTYTGVLHTAAPDNDLALALISLQDFLATNRPDDMRLLARAQAEDVYKDTRPKLTKSGARLVAAELIKMRAEQQAQVDTGQDGQ